MLDCKIQTINLLGIRMKDGGGAWSLLISGLINIESGVVSSLVAAGIAVFLLSGVEHLPRNP